MRRSEATVSPENKRDTTKVDRKSQPPETKQSTKVDRLTTGFFKNRKGVMIISFLDDKTLGRAASTSKAAAECARSDYHRRALEALKQFALHPTIVARTLVANKHQQTSYNGVSTFSRKSLGFPTREALDAALKGQDHKNAFDNAMALIDVPLQYFLQTSEFLSLEPTHPLCGFLKFYSNYHAASPFYDYLERLFWRLGDTVFDFLKELKETDMVEKKEETLGKVKAFVARGARFNFCYRYADLEKFCKLPNAKEVFEIIIHRCEFYYMDRYYNHQYQLANLVRCNQPEIVSMLLTRATPMDDKIIMRGLEMANHNCFPECVILFISYFGKQKMEQRLETTWLELCEVWGNERFGETIQAYMNAGINIIEYRMRSYGTLFDYVKRLPCKQRTELMKLLDPKNYQMLAAAPVVDNAASTMNNRMKK